MGRLIHTAICSLDGYVEDAGGGFAWAEPDAEVHAHVNAAEAAFGTHLLGRRMYEIMRWWQDPPAAALAEPVIKEYADVWQAADKVVHSRTLATVDAPRTRLASSFEADDVRALKAAADRDLTIGGAELAGQALAAGLVDELRLYLSPVVIGAGKRALPDGVRLQLELTDERRFASGVVYLAHRVIP